VLELPLIDIILICFLFGFVAVGFWLGLIHMVGSLVGFVAGVFLAGRYYEVVSSWIIGVWPSANENIVRVLVFFALFTIITRLVGLLVGLLEGIFRVISIIPFVKTFNRLLGAAVGLVEGVLVMGLLIYFSSRFPFGSAYELALQNSLFARVLFKIGSLLSPLLPEALRLIQPVIS
jgi:membrane protein required for colicin V production